MHWWYFWSTAPPRAWFALAGIATCIALVLAVIANLGIRALWLAVVAIAIAVIARSPTIVLYDTFCGLRCGQGVRIQADGIIAATVGAAGLLTALRRFRMPARLISSTLLAGLLLAYTITWWIA